MHVDDIVTGLTDAQVVHIKSLIQQLKAELKPFGVKKTPEERQALNSVDQGRAPFVDLTAEVARDYHEDLMIDAPMVARTARIHYDFKVMSEIETDLESVVELVSDTKMQIGHNCFNNGLVVKALVEVAIKRRIPGMETLADKIVKLWDRIRKPKGGNGDDQSDSLPNPDDSPVV